MERASRNLHNESKQAHNNHGRKNTLTDIEKRTFSSETYWT